MRSGVALAIFVKTPGLSPIKTRLAESIGEESARQFYELAVKATQAVAMSVRKQMPNVEVYWAVAEHEGLQSPIWRAFPKVFQGEGSLGDRLASVYDQLISRHQQVCFIGADSPHLSVQELKEAIDNTTAQESFVIGETLDGGFYFFGGTLPLSSELWCSVKYSSPRTSIELKAALLKIGKVTTARTNFDIDLEEDLDAYRKYSTNSPRLLKEQQELISWVKLLESSRGVRARSGSGRP